MSKRQSDNKKNPRGARSSTSSSGRDGRAGKRSKGGPAGFHIYGIHSVEAALRNEARSIEALYVSKNAEQRLESAISNRGIRAVPCTSQDLDLKVGPDAVHQGAVLKTRPLPETSIEDLSGSGLCLVLDQVTDPHNVGAIIRSAAAFGVEALVMTERNSPALCGVLAKTASGGLEHVPVILVTNLSRALGQMADLGYQRLGLDSEEAVDLVPSLRSEATALVLGAEGKGLRRLTRENCDLLCRIKTSGGVASLNVSNASAVALFALQGDG